MKLRDFVRVDPILFEIYCMLFVTWFTDSCCVRLLSGCQVSSDEEVAVFQPTTRTAAPIGDDVSLGDVSVDVEDETEYLNRLDHILSRIPTSNQATSTDSDTHHVSVTKEAHQAKISETEKETDTLDNGSPDGGSGLIEGNCRNSRYGSCRTTNMWARRAHVRHSEENAKAIATRFMPAEPPTLTMKNIDIGMSDASYIFCVFPLIDGHCLRCAHAQSYKIKLWCLSSSGGSIVVHCSPL